jgi:hypothetical protein
MGKAAQAAHYAQQNPNCLRVAYLYDASVLMEKIAMKSKQYAQMMKAPSTSNYDQLSSKQRKRALRREKYATHGKRLCVDNTKLVDAPEPAVVEEHALDQLSHYLANVMTQIRIKTHTPVQPYMFIRWWGVIFKNIKMQQTVCRMGFEFIFCFTDPPMPGSVQCANGVTNG